MTDYTAVLFNDDLIFGTADGPTCVIFDPPPVTPDVTPPVVALVSPSAGSAITRDTEIVIDVTDAVGLATAPLFASYPSGAYDVVHDGVAFATYYAISSRAAISGGYRYKLRRVGGWRESPTFKPRPVDTGGNLG